MELTPLARIINELLEATEPFHACAAKVPLNWRGDVPLKQQRGGYHLPTVDDYRELKRAHEQLKTYMEDKGGREK